MGILTQSQIIFWENLNFQNCLNQQIFTPGEKKRFWRTQVQYLLPLPYHKFMTTFFLSELSQKNYFFPTPLFFTIKIIFCKKKKMFFLKKQFWSWKIEVWEKNNFFVLAQNKKKKVVIKIYAKLVEVMVVSFFKKQCFFHLGSKFVDLSDFENLNFPKKLFDFDSKFPFVGSKFLFEICVENPHRPYIPCAKNCG